MKDWRELYRFWFETDAADYVADRWKLWFLKNEEADARAREFVPWIRDFRLGRLTDWLTTPPGHLTAIVLLDQIPRNAFRDDARAFENDALGLELCLAGLRDGKDRDLGYFERVFFYLPLEHAEDAAMQARSVECYRRLLAEAPEAYRKLAQGALDFAIRHQRVIDRFGRYPHRNQALGRASTAEELAFLAEPGSRF